MGYEKDCLACATIRGMNTEAQRPELPDHLSIDPKNPHFVAAVFEHDVGIRFNGKDRHDVEEYCVSEGWVKVPAGKTVDRKGNPLMLKLKGLVEPFYR
jgi:hypothetical protein